MSQYIFGEAREIRAYCIPITFVICFILIYQILSHNAVLGARLGLGKSGIGMAAAELVQEVLKVSAERCSSACTIVGGVCQTC